MRFLKTLDIDGISEHTQLFRLESDQVNKILQHTIQLRVQRMNMKALLNNPLDDGKPPEVIGYLENSDSEQEEQMEMQRTRQTYPHAVPRENLNTSGGLFFGNQSFKDLSSR